MAKGWKGVELRLPGELGYDARRPYRFGCPVRLCYYYVSSASKWDAEMQEREHRCPHSGTTRLAWNNVTRTLVEQMWDKLDAEMKDIMEAGGKNQDIQILLKKTRARAYAECLAIFMPPHFHTADEVAQEAMRRYKAKQADDRTYQTAGLDQRRYEGVDSWKRAQGGWTADATQALSPSQQAQVPARVTRANARKPEIRLSDKEQAGIKFAAASGMFTEERLAKTYGVSVAVIQAVLST